MTADLAAARVLVTGAHGFLGRRLVRALEARGAAKNVLAPSHAELDLLDRARLKAYLADARPDVVFHLAARVGGIGHNRANAGVLFHDNLLMGVHLLDEAMHAGAQKVVAVATVCAYPAQTPVPFRETSLWDGYPEPTNAPYGLAKKMLLVQSQAYRKQYGFNSVVLFPANLYGPGDNFDLESGHVVPALIRKIHDARRAGLDRVTLWGDGTPTREMLYVDDGAEALCLAAERYDASDPVNVGTGEEISIRALAERIAALYEWEGELVFDASMPNGQMRRKLDVSRAEALFGFSASTPLDEGLARTVAWWRERTA